jgi:hypothetical protein
MLAKRGTLQALPEPQYLFKEVPKAKRDLSGSVVLPVNERQLWIESLAEILLLCNEAANRRKSSFYVPPAARGKPLALEYLADRVDLDDPLTGFMVRTEKEGWLQGFITVTTFTTWQRWFRWDSLIPDAGVVDEHIDLEEDEEIKVWLKKRKRDLDGSLAIELQSQIFDGDYSSNGVIWPRIAEVTLLGGLGCGTLLMNKIIYDMETPSCQYDYIVLQATENAVEFYERFGFVRVGAVARYEEVVPSDHEGESTEDDEEESQSSGSEYEVSGEEDGEDESEEESDGEDDSEDDDADSDEDDDDGEEDDEEEDDTSEDGEESEESEESDDDNDSSSDYEEEEESRSSKGKKKRGRKQKKKEISNKKLKVEKVDDGLTDRERRALRRKALLKAEAKVEAEATASNSNDKNENDNNDNNDNNGNSNSNSVNEKVEKVKSEKTAESSVLTSDFFWYEAKADETATIISRKFGLRVWDILYFNRKVLPGLKASAKLYGGTKLRVPKIPDITKLKEEAKERLRQHHQSLVPGDISDPTAAWYIAIDDESPREIAGKLGVSTGELIHANCNKLEGLNRHSRLVEGTRLRIPGRKIAGEIEGEENAPPLVAYRHWTFSNDSVDTTCVSYMMVRKLNKRKPPKRNQKTGLYEEVPVTREEKAALLVERKLRMFAPKIKETRFFRQKQEEIRQKKLEEDRRIELEEIEEARRKALPKIPIKVKLKMKGLQGKRLIGPLTATNCNGGSKNLDSTFRVYLNNTGYYGYLRADLEKPLMKPVPPEPVKPKRNMSGYLLFSNSRREVLTKTHPDLYITDISKLIGAQWGAMTVEEKAPYQEKSRIGKIEYLKRQSKYHEKLRVYERAVNLREKLRLKHHGPTPEELDKMKGKKKKTHNKKTAADHDHKRLFNKVVKVLKNEHGWKYFFVLTYIPDLQWVHLAPMHQRGIFTTEKKGVAMGRPKWMLAPEGKACEIDITASRCVPVRNRVMRNCPDADKEQWDIFEDNDFSCLGDVMYKSVFDALHMDMLLEDITPKPTVTVGKDEAEKPPPAPESNTIMSIVNNKNSVNDTNNVDAGAGAKVYASDLTDS